MACGACRSAVPDQALLKPEKDPAEVPAGWCASGCEDEVAFTMDLNERFFRTTPGKILAPYLGKRRGEWVHRTHPREPSALRLDPNTYRRPGSFALRYRGGRARYIRSRPAYSPPVDNFGCTLDATVCQDSLEYDVIVEIKSDDGSLDEKYTSTLQVESRETYATRTPKARTLGPKGRAFLNDKQRPVAFSGTQTLSVQLDANERLAKHTLSVWMHLTRWGAPSVMLESRLATHREPRHIGRGRSDHEYLFEFRQWWRRHHD